MDVLNEYGCGSQISPAHASCRVILAVFKSVYQSTCLCVISLDPAAAICQSERN